MAMYLPYTCLVVLEREESEKNCHGIKLLLHKHKINKHSVTSLTLAKSYIFKLLLERCAAKL